MSKFFLLAVLFLNGLLTQAQKHEWLSTAQHSSTTVLSSKSNIQTTDASGNVYIIGNFRGTIFFPADTISFTTPNQFSAYVAKYDAKGNNLWAKLISANNSVVISSVQVNRQQELVFYGNYFNGNVNPIVLGSDTLRLNRAAFLAFMDTSGQFKSATNIATGGAVATAYRMAFAPNDDIVLTGYHSFGTKSLFDSGTAVNVTLSCCDFYLARFSPSGKRLRWHRSYETTRLSFDQGLDVSSDNQIYVGFILGQSQSAFGLSAGTSGPRAGVAWFRGDGTFYKARISGESNLRGFECIVARDSNFIFLSGTALRDSFTWVNKKLYPQGALSSTALRTFCFALVQNHWDSIAWSHTSTYHTSTATNNNIGVMSAAMEGEFIFLSFETKIGNTDTFQFAGFKIAQNLPGKLVKFDFRGNALWILNTPTDLGVSSVNMAGNGDVAYSGVVSQRPSFSFDPFSYTRPSSGGFWLYVAKTFDYSIARGNVRSGPYCAGDTILVPYLKFGDYDTANLFIAELSDEQGNFLGGERELGKIKTNQDSLVIGRLPLFEVASSPKYRIRIRSTHPIVQSFYLLDSLRLLIYSRDKANPGPDTTICRGQNIKLNTFGGTTWLWSPNINMDNPRFRTPAVRPDTSTTYTIIIGDSSGCGAPDTASIRVFVRNPLQVVQKSQSDSLACLGKMVSLKAVFEGGLPQNYRALWFNMGGKLLANRPAFSGRDSLEFRFTGDTLIYVVLTDSCTQRNDTARFQVRLFDPIVNLQFPLNKTLCQGEEIVLKTLLNHARPDSVRYVWRRLSNNQILSQTDSMSWTGGSFGVSIGVELLNTCDNRSYQDRFDLFSRTPWSVKIGRNPVVDSLCYGAEMELFALSSGGKPGPGAFFWSVDGNAWSSDSNKYFKSTEWYDPSGPEIQGKWIRLTGSDGCSRPDVRDSLWVKLLPPLKLKRNQDSVFTACYGNAYAFKSEFSGGLGNGRYVHHWWLNHLSVSDSFGFELKSKDVYDINGAGPHRLLQVLSDGCSRNDSLIFTLKLTPPLQMQIQKGTDTLSLCNGNEQLFRAVYSGGRPDSTILQWQINEESWTSQDSLKLLFYKGYTTRDSLVRVRCRWTDPCYPNEIYDSVFVQIRNSPLLSFTGNAKDYKQTSDTLICLGQAFEPAISAYFSQLAANETQWYVNGQLMGNRAMLRFDNSIYQLKVNDTLQIKAIMNDGCSVDADTAVMRVRIRPDLNLLPLSDTTLCFGSDLWVSASLTGGLNTQYRYQWFDDATDLPLGSQRDLQLLNVTKNKILRVQGTDDCSSNLPVRKIQVFVLSPISADILASDTCFDVTSNLIATASGGNGNYQYQWLENGTALTSTAASIEVNPEQNTLYTLVVTDNCSQPAASAQIRIAPIPQFEILRWDSVACSPYVPDYEALSLNGETYTYSLFNGAQAIDGQTLNDGIYQLQLFSQNDLGCRFSRDLGLRVKPLPNASFSYSPDDPSFDNPNVEFTAQNLNSDAYTWLLNGAIISQNASFNLTFNDTGTYEVRLRAELESCINEEIQWLRFRDNFRYYRVSAFSPNGDGLNDRYQPVAHGIESGFYTIYNRWGGVVFQGATDAVWDGTYQGEPVAAGTYQVIIQLIDRQGKRSFIQEQLQLMR